MDMYVRLDYDKLLPDLNWKTKDCMFAAMDRPYAFRNCVSTSTYLRITTLGSRRCWGEVYLVQSMPL
jgi:hypothetical protein